MPEGIKFNLWKKRKSTLSVSVFELKIRIPQYLICEVNKVEFQRAENPKGIAGNKCALEQVQAADEQFERSDTKHLLPAIPFGFSFVLNSTFFPTSQTNILLFNLLILGYNDYEKVCLCN